MTPAPTEATVDAARRAYLAVLDMPREYQERLMPDGVPYRVQALLDLCRVSRERDAARSK